MGQYLPVLFELDDFQLTLNTQAAAKFHQRMKELGFVVQESKGLMIWQRDDSRLCAQLNPDMSLSFLPDFYDKTPGGTVYAILEKLCVTFGGTMVGRYKINHPQINHQWSVRISGGMNLTGDAAVGKRDQVSDVTETAIGASASSSSQTLANGRQSFSTQEEDGSGHVQTELARPLSARDKAYKFFVEERYAKWVQDENGGQHDLNKFTEFVREFNAQFPPEEEAEEEKTWKKIRTALTKAMSLPDEDDHILQVTLGAMDVDVLDEMYEDIAQQSEFTPGEINAYVNWKLFNGPSPISTAAPQAQVQPVSAPAQTGQQVMQQVAQAITQNLGVPANQVQVGNQNLAQMAQGNAMNLSQWIQQGAPQQSSVSAAPASWMVPETEMEECVRWIGAKIYYALKSNNTAVLADLRDDIDVMRILTELLTDYRLGSLSSDDVYYRLQNENIDPVSLHAGLKQVVPKLKPVVTP